MGKVPSRAEAATIFAELAGGALKPEQAADMALGTQLRAYSFDRYKTKRKEGEERAGQGAGHHRGRQRRGGAEGLGVVAAARRGRRDHGARPDQRAGQRAVSGGIRPPRHAR